MATSYYGESSILLLIYDLNITPLASFVFLASVISSLDKIYST